MRRLFSMGCCLIAGLVMSSAVVGQERRSPDIAIWLGIGYGDVEDRALAADGFDSAGPRVGIHLGFSEWIGIEAGWQDFGTADGHHDPFPVADNELIPARQQSSAFWLAYAPTFQHAQWRLSGRIGAARLSRDLRLIGSSFTADSTDTELLLGVSADYLSRESPFGVRFDLDRIGGEATAVGASVSYRF